MEFLSLSRRCSSARNVPSGEERGETDVFAGYIDSRLKQVFVFFRPPEVINFRLKSLLETTFAQRKQICSFDDGDTHTRSIDLVGVESAHSATEVKDSQMKSETPNASHATPHVGGEMQMATHQARQVDLSRLRRSRSAASRPKRLAPLP